MPQAVGCLESKRRPGSPLLRAPVALPGGASTWCSNSDDANGEDCPADLTGEVVLDFFDISAFRSAFNAKGPAADFTGEGVFDFFDVSAFLAAFSAGCL